MAFILNLFNELEQNGKKRLSRRTCSFYLLLFLVALMRRIHDEYMKFNMPLPLPTAGIVVGLFPGEELQI